jgi:YidC/Oxa1 family membrane protein insertase
MDKRFFAFLVLAMLVMTANHYAMKWFFPPPPVVEKPPQDAKPAEPKPAAAAKPKADAPQGEKPAADPVAAAEPKVDETWATLGSLDENSPYRMLVTFSNRGAAVERVELNHRRYHDVDNIHPLGGYLGHLAARNRDGKKGSVVGVVGTGTPAAAAGIKIGDVITSLDGEELDDVAAFSKAMRKTKPKQTVKLGYERDGKPQTVEIVLRPHPLEVVKQEAPDRTKPDVVDPPSFLLTIDRLDDASLDIDEAELPNVAMRTALWETLPADAANPDEIAFRRTLRESGIEVTKRYTLLRRDDADAKHASQPYTLKLRVEVKNTGSAAHRVGYRLDGPTGLPAEGFWYARGAKLGATSGSGMRDVVHGRYNGAAVESGMYTCTAIAKNEATVIADAPLAYIGVDSQYFAAVVLPQYEKPGDKWFPRVKPIAVGPVPEASDKIQLTDVSFRMSSNAVEAEPGTTAFAHDFKIYLGPKVPELLAENGLGDLIYFGWFGWVARPMLAILHFFYGIVGNYGIAIILLTVVVRSAMFPLSRKQALNAMKMQELQPEIKQIAEKYKKNPEQRMKAQQDLFRKHNYNPFSGCLPIFIQLPIFMGLYRSLAVDVELRQAPLINESVRWASNLSAPDMFWYWQPLFPLLTGEEGWLGPFLNLLPCVTIVLFIVQQKMFMPPPTDEQSAMQQKMMKYMMIFMGFMFFKVPAGLCVYFITSSVWSIAERMILPKAKPAPISGAVVEVAAKPTNGERKGKRR